MNPFEFDVILWLNNDRWMSIGMGLDLIYNSGILSKKSSVIN